MYMLLSRIKCLKTKESQLQAEVHGDSTSSPAWPSPNVPAALPGPRHSSSFPPSTPGSVWAFKMPPTWTQWSWSAPPMSPAPLSPITSSYPRSSQSPAPVPAHLCCCLPALCAEPSHHPSQLALKQSPKTWLQHELLQGLNNDRDIPILQYPGFFYLTCITLFKLKLASLWVGVFLKKVSTMKI